ncbi:MAG: protein kinase [Rhodothermia bacterium]|nr:protein kinase [Rhodothermia bacterium]
MGSRQSIGGIRPFAELTRGQMTVVYKGYDPSADRFVLLKVLRPDYSRDPAVREAFSNESRLLARVQHPNVVAVVDSGIDGDTGFLVTEFVEGLSLREMMDRGEIPPPIAAYIAAQTADGLQAAHRAGILHRDLKPDNILLSIRGEVKITDSGMAVTSKSAGEQRPLIAGTLGFVAPEVINGDTPSEASDVFSLGATFYHMLTGVTAFTGSNDGEIIDATLNRNPMHRVDEYCTAPPGLLVICGRLLQKRPGDRISTSAEVVSALHGWLAEHGAAISAAELAQFVSEPSTVPKASMSSDGSERMALVAEARTTASQRHPAPHPRQQDVAVVYPSRRWKPVAAAAAVVTVLLAASLFAVSDLRVNGGSSSAGDSELAAAPFLSLPADSAVSDTQFATRTRPASDDSSGIGDNDDSVADAVPIAVIEDRRGAGQPPASTESLVHATERASVPDAVNVGSESIETVAGPDPDDSAARKPEAGTISVRTVPWASLWLDGTSLGESFADTLTLEAGAHQLVLRNPDFPDVVETIEVIPGVHRDYNLSLWARVARLSLVVVPWAVVEIDGVIRDTIPPQETPFILPPGAHRLRLTHPELGVITRDVLLTAGERRSLSYNMRRASAE